MKKFIVLIATVFMINSSIAFAGDKDHYFNLFGSVINQHDLDATSNDLRLDGNVSDKSGFGFGMALGHKFGENFRVEAQYARRDVSINVKDKKMDDPRTNMFYKDMSDKQKEAVEVKGSTWADDARFTTTTLPNNDGISTTYKNISGTLTNDTTNVAKSIEERTTGYSYAPISAFFDEDNLVVQTAMVNGYFDMPYGDITPYVGGGLGIGFINLEDETNFAWQLMAGVRFAVTDRVSANVGWTRLDAGEVEIRRGAYKVTTDTSSDSVDFGISYSF